MSNTSVHDITPLAGMKLKRFWAHNTPVNDVTFSRFLYFTPKNINKGIEILRSMDSLREIGITKDRRLPAAEFWEKYNEERARK